MKLKNIKYPIEIELTDFCWLKCASCVNPLLKNKGFLSINDFEIIIDYIYKNKDNILYINFSWIGDVFLHKDFNLLIDLFIVKFKNTWVNVLIPTKWQSINVKHLETLKKISINWINLNISIWMYSLIENVHNSLSWSKTFYKTIEFMKDLKKNNICFSLELLKNKVSEKENKIFNNFINKVWIWWSIHNYHNFWWSINNKNYKYWKEECSFDWWWYQINWFYCAFIPFISKSWNLYSCSVSWKNKTHMIWNIKKLFIKFPDFRNLVLFIKNDFLNKDKCKNCSIYEWYTKNYE